MLEADKTTLIGLHFSDITHPEDKEKSLAAYRETKITKNNKKLESRYITPSGKEIVCDTSLNFIDKNGDSYFVTQSANITEREAIKKSVLRTLDELKNIAEK
ncbi:MAG: PAS domain S-box protein [Synergistaceae bacterium]